jgi:endonuclease/exonuclease/phosphatase family metal-dependent hydrolase
MLQVAAILCSLLGLVLTGAREPDPAWTVMTFNIRYGTADDGDDRWTNREELVYGVIRDRDADIVGLQEALDFQIDAITDSVPGYGVIGVGRDDGATKGEFSAILYKLDRFYVDRSGTFWLSDTPEAVGSTSWGNEITRICTWARLIDRATGEAIMVYNTHFDHRSQESRLASATLIGQRIKAHRGERVVLLGDFNAGEDNQAMLYLTTHRGGPRLVDTFRAAHPDATGVGTFNAFKGESAGDKIDHVFVNSGFTTLDAGIDRTNEDGRYPSDHFPVWARITLSGS